MDLVDGLKDKKYLAPREFVSQTFMLYEQHGDYCDRTKKVTDNNNKNNNNYSYRLNITQIFRINVTFVPKFWYFADRASR